MNNIEITHPIRNLKGCTLRLNKKKTVYLHLHDSLRAYASTIFTVIAVAFLSFLGYAQPGCSPATTNGNCLAATTLVVGDPCVAGTTCGGSGQLGSCLYTGSECSWYSFTATATAMFVNIEVTANNGCHISSNIIESTGSCVGTEISCQSGTPLDDLHSLTGLTVGTVYYVQVCYSPGGPCGNGGSAEYCIEVGEPDPPCNTCASPCGTALGYASSPTVQQVVDDCTTSTFSPALQPGTLHRYCNSFTATSTTVNFNVIITSNCTGGNVTSLTWDLYNDPACGAAIQSGDINGLTFSGLTVGNNYVFCYKFTVPVTCTHFQHCPYFVGATVLPVDLLHFGAEVIDNSIVDLNWSTATETNNDHFTVERSVDLETFEEIGYVQGMGNSTVITHYNIVDQDPFHGISYYRLKQTDHNGKFMYYNVVSVELINSFSTAAIVPNPLNGNGALTFDSGVEGIAYLKIYDVFGRVVLSEDHISTKGMNSIPLQTEFFSKGMYILSIVLGEEQKTIRFIKDQ